MINVILCGCTGRMGRAVTELINGSDTLRIVAGVDVNTAATAPTCKFPVYQTINEFPDKADVIIDFSHHTALASLLEYAKTANMPIVVCTTGHTEEERALMQESAKDIPVFFSRNMSLGINLLAELCRKAAKTLGIAFDVEIIEKHHNQKLDAPSGTALMLAEALAEEREDTKFVYDRHDRMQKRDKKEIGIHAVRGGTIVGEHEVIFAGNNEIITLSHSATSREIFANGAMKAAEFIVDKLPGMYDMSDVINQEIS